MTTEPRLSRFRRASAWYGYVADILTPQRLALGFGVLALGVIGLFGGWGAVGDAAEETPVVAAETVFSAAPFELTVERVLVFEDLEPAFHAEEGFRYIAVMLDVTNTSDRPVPALVLSDSTSLDAQGLRTIELDTGPKTVAPQVVRTVDSLTQRTFQPGLTTNVVLVWQQSSSEAVPVDASLTFSGNTWRRSTLGDDFGWRDPASAARLSLPIDPLEAA